MDDPAVAEAQDVDLSPEGLARLSRHSNPQVLRCVAQNPATPPEVLGEMERRVKASGVRLALGGAPALPADARDRMAGEVTRKWSPSVGYVLAARIDMPLDTRIALLVQSYLDTPLSRPPVPHEVFAPSSVPDDDFRELVVRIADMRGPDPAGQAATALWPHVEGGLRQRMLDLTGIHPDNEAAKTYVQGIYGHTWVLLTPDHPDVLLALTVSRNP